MALPEFDYVLAKSLPEAAALNACDDVRVMAGGTDVILLVQAKAFKGLKRVVDLKGIQGLDKVEFVEGDGLHIGSLAKLYAIQNDPEVKKHLPAVAQAAHYVASAQIRRKGTMAGNIVNASPSADTVPILLASNASVKTYDKDGNTRTINMNEFYKGFRKYDLDKSKGELISEIYIPELKPHEGSAYLKLSVRKAMDLAIIGTAAWVRMDGKKIEDCRIALGGVAVNAIRAPKAEAFLKGKELTDEVLEQAGNLKQTLKELNRETYDYREFLKKFASLGENLETNEDEFDYIYYIYGMDHYGNMPLVEPLEYKEVKKVREIVIAIDTSESVSGDLVQQFVQKTWNMLKQTDSFFSRVNIHILQCGAKVEEDVSIKSQEDLDAYLKSMMLLKGFGGTDFRPVFEKVNELIRSHAFSNFRGLIYFTDGYGTYPAMPPAYPTAFVFLDHGHEIPEVPTWAIRLVLKENEIHDL